MIEFAADHRRDARDFERPRVEDVQPGANDALHRLGQREPVLFVFNDRVAVAYRHRALLEQRRAHLFEENGLPPARSYSRRARAPDTLRTPSTASTIEVEAAKSSRSRRTNVVDAGQRSAAPCSARLVTISSAGGRRRDPPRGRRPHAIPYPPSASLRRHDERSEPCQRSDDARARRAAPPEDVRRADASATRRHRSAPTEDADRAAGTARAMRSSARTRATTSEPVSGGCRSRRRAQNLDEHAVGHAVAVRAATRLDEPQSRLRAEAFLQLVQQPALAGARLADDRNHRAGVSGSPGDARLQRRQLGLTADVRRQSRSPRGFQPRRDAGLAEDAERRHQLRLRIEHDGGARRRVHVRPDETLRLRAYPDVAGVRQDRERDGLRQRRADDVVAARPFVQTTSDDRSDVQTRLHAQAKRGRRARVDRSLPPARAGRGRREPPADRRLRAPTARRRATRSRRRSPGSRGRRTLGRRPPRLRGHARSRAARPRERRDRRAPDNPTRG